MVFAVAPGTAILADVVLFLVCVTSSPLARRGPHSGHAEKRIAAGQIKGYEYNLA